MDKDSIEIRLEEQKDQRIVEEITREAFWNVYTLGASEHFMLNQLRKSSDFIPQLSFVATINNKIVGSIFYSKSKIIDSNGNIHNSITFAPISVSPNFQGMGVAKKLIKHSLDVALNNDYQSVIIYGNPEYYERFGFVRAKKFNISAQDGIFYKALLCLELKKDCFSSLKKFKEPCKFLYSSVFNVNETDLDIFDKTFIKKEKIKTKSQKEFEKLINEVDK